MLRDFGGGWPLARPLDHRRNPNQPPLALDGRELVPLGIQTSASLIPAFSMDRGAPSGLPGSRPNYLSCDMERPTRFEHNQWVGDKRNQVVHDVDACTEPDIINELLEAETYLSFGPDSLPEARNRGYRRCDRCEGMRVAQD